MEIQQFNRESKGFFKAVDGEKEAGRMTYSWAGTDKMIIDHTEVNPEFQGKNVGMDMLMTAVGYARDHNIKIIPLCPFAKKMFDRTATIQDVLS